MVVPRGFFNICLVVGNITLALLAFCFAFVLVGATKLPQMIVVPGVCAFAGMFLSYGAIVAIVAVFGHAALPQRVASLVAGIAIAFCLLYVSFGVMGELDMAATHFVGGVIAGMLWLALLQNIFGWRIQPKDAELFLKPTRQFDLRLLFYWTVGFAILFCLLRRSTVTSASLLALVAMALITSTLVLAIVASIIRPRKKVIWGMGTLILTIVGVLIEICVLKSVIPSAFPIWLTSVIVVSANTGIVLAALASGVSFRLMRFTIVRTRATHPQAL